MNRMHRIVWSRRLLAWVVAHERVRSQGKSRTALLPVVAFTMGLTNAASAQTLPPPNTLPSAGQVTAGNASLQQNGATLQIDQTSERAAIQWGSFNVGSAAKVNFNQPNAQAVTLNRVLDSNPSQIHGSITATGQVWLLNPNGVLFGKTANVDVGGLVATTHSMTDAAFMAGGNSFTEPSRSATVTNQGTLQAKLGSYIALLAPEVRNEAMVVVPLGTAVLASGETITLHLNGTGLSGISVTPSQLNALVENKNAVIADEGTVILSARAVDGLLSGVVNNSGRISATGLTQKGGRILLEASSQTLLNGNSVLDASSAGAQGGNITLAGQEVTIADQSRLDARGATGGGSVLAGGDWQGSGPMRQATTTTMQEGATIDVSATQNGNGGTAVLWSDVNNTASQTTARGTILATQGADGGNGGRIETSGRQLSVSGQFNAGNGGTWLLDPVNVTISNAADNPPSAINANALNASLNASSQTITVSTTSGLTEAGDITLASDTSITSTGLGSLVLDAARDINLQPRTSIDLGVGNSGCASNSGCNITFRAGRNITQGTMSNTNDQTLVQSNGGDIIYWADVDRPAGATNSSDGVISVGQNATIRSSGGDIVMGGGQADPQNAGRPGEAASGDPNNRGGIALHGLSTAPVVLDAGTGNVIIRGSSDSAVNATPPSLDLGLSYGVYLQDTRIAAKNLQITGSNNTSSTPLTTADELGYGVMIRSSTITATENISITGTNTEQSNRSKEGIGIGMESTTLNAGGNITLDGTGNGDRLIYGVQMASSPVIAAGNISITGSAIGRELAVMGVQYRDSSIKSNAGNILLKGTADGGSNARNARGINLVQSTVENQSTNHTITINGSVTGTGTGTAAHGVRISANSTNPGPGSVSSAIGSAQSGPITVIGTNTSAAATTNAGFSTLGTTYATGSSTAAAINLQGTSTEGHGILIDGTTTTTTLNASHADSGISIKGTSSSTDSGKYGVLNDANTVALNAGTSGIAIDGNAQGIKTGAGTIQTPGNITLTGDRIQIGSAVNLNSEKAVVAQPSGNSFSEPLIWNALTGSTAESLTIGKNTNTANIAIDSPVSLADGLVQVTGGDLTINNDISSRSVLLTATGTITQPNAASGRIQADTLGVQGGSDVTLTKTNNNVDTLAANRTGNFRFRNEDDLAIGAINAISGINAGGIIDIATVKGNLVINQNITTTNTSNQAITLNSDVNRSVGTSLGGNIVIGNNAAITTGAGGRATLMTGSVAGSTGLTALVGAGSGRFRYNSDEIARSYTRALDTGLNAIYRERPMVTVKANDANKTYDALAYSGGNGVTYGGTVNGDATTGFPATAAYSGTSQNAANAGTYAISAIGLSHELGYGISSYADGTLTVNKANLVLSGTREYNGSATVAGTAMAAVGVAGQRFALTGSGTLSSPNVQTNQPISNLGTLALGDGAGGALAMNYHPLSVTDSLMSVTPAPVSVTSTNVEKIYDGNTAVPGASATLVGGRLFGNDTLTNGNFSYDDKNAGENKRVTGSGVLVNDGNGGANYSVSYVDNPNGVINRADLVITGSQNYDGSTNMLGTNLTAIGVAGETFSLNGNGTLASRNVQTDQPLASVAGLALGDSSNGGLAGNYREVSQATSSVSVTPRPLSVTYVGEEKVADGTTTASVVTRDDRIVGDDLTVLLDARFRDPLVGRSKPVDVNDIRIIGADASNYSLSPTALSAASIIPDPDSAPLPAPPLPVLPPPAALPLPVVEGGPIRQTPPNFIALNLPSAPSPVETTVRVNLVSELQGDAPGRVAVLLPNDAGVRGGAVWMPLPQAAVDCHQADWREPVQVYWQRDGRDEPLPEWLGFDPDSCALWAHDVPPDGLPIRLRLTRGDRVTWVALKRVSSL